MGNFSGALVLGLAGLWIILQTTKGPLAKVLGLTSS
jgi:hypothetical protein